MKAFLFILSLCLSIIFLNNTAAYPEGIIGSGCSISNVGYLNDLAKEYEKRTGLKVFVRGGGSVVGIEDLRTGRVDFAASCRDKEADDPEDVRFIQIAWDALVFIVNQSNSINDITLEEVRSIYSGKIINWKQLGGDLGTIKLFISRPQKGLSGVESATKNMILKGENPVVTKNTVTLPSSGIVEQMIEKTPEGFGTTGFSSARKRNIKMLSLNGVSPTKENIINRKYDLIRPLFILVPEEPKQEVKKFVDFILSKEGQQIISSLGAISLSDIK